jgi:hypothetical protein
LLNPEVIKIPAWNVFFIPQKRSAIDCFIHIIKTREKRAVRRSEGIIIVYRVLIIVHAQNENSFGPFKKQKAERKLLFKDAEPVLQSSKSAQATWLQVKFSGVWRCLDGE